MSNSRRSLYFKSLGRLAIVFLLLFNPFFLETGFSIILKFGKKAPPFINSTNEYNLNFFEIKSVLKTNEKASVTLVAVGDTRITRIKTVYNAYDTILNKNMENMSNWLESRDIVIGNLEMAFSDPDISCSSTSGTGMPGWGKLFRDLNFSVFNVANNHFQFDAGICGIKTSLEVLRNNEILSTGIGQNFLIIEKNGLRIGMLGYARYTMNSSKLPDEYKIGDFIYKSILDDIKQYKSKVDHLVISIHWGEPLFENPNPEEEKMAKRLIEAGASLIIGTGPHVLQKIDIYENGAVAYSLGNFIFDEFITNQTANRMAEKTCFLEVTFSKKEIKSIRIFPILNNSGRISIPTSNEYRAYKHYLDNLYHLNKSDFYDKYPLRKRISDRLKILFKETRQNPIDAFKKNVKLRYVNRILFLLWTKYKYEIIIFISVLVTVCFLLVLKIKKRENNHF